MTDLIGRTLHRLNLQLSGRVSVPSNDRYATPTAIWAKSDRTPRAVVHCQTAEDVQAAIRAARTCDLPLSVRAGGHDWAGRALCDGLVIDLSGMNRVDRYLEISTARVGGGTRASGLLEAIEPFGMAAVTGSCAPVGMAGLALGGGYGPLIGRYGLALDNLLAVEVVLSDGRIVTAHNGDEQELFWAFCIGARVAARDVDRAGGIEEARSARHVTYRFRLGLADFVDLRSHSRSRLFRRSIVRLHP